jgi:chemotaxis signal transduction protein/SRSO17 transposase
VAHTAQAPADFTSTFRQRFAPLFGRKIARQRAEQYLGGLLCGRAERRNVTALAATADGATARALGWLLNKSPWPTRPILDALQTYVAESLAPAGPAGPDGGLFTLNLDSFVKRGDNAVGVDKQYVHHLNRTLNCQIGVFLAYGAGQGSALVDAALYMPHSWIDGPARREKAGVPDTVAYQPRSEIALDLLRRTRAAGILPGQWVTSWHGEGFEPDLRARLDADGWRYLLPVDWANPFYDGPDAVTPQPASGLVEAQDGAGLALRRVWDAAPDTSRHPFWLVSCTDELTGRPVAFVSNTPEDDALETLSRIVAARWDTARMLAARCAGVSLDVYRVRGWDGWHRHVALALLASAFRACLPVLPEADAALDSIDSYDTYDIVPEAPAESDLLAPAELEPRELMAEDRAAPYDEAEPEPAAALAEDAAPTAAPAADEPAAPTTYHLVVDLAETDWRAVRAFQTWLVADEAGTILFSSPTRAEIERQEVGASMEMRFESALSIEQLVAALDEVPEIGVTELAAEVAGAAAPTAAPTVGEPAAPTAYHLVVSLAETDWRAVRAFQTWLVADEAGTILFSSPTRAEIEREEVGTSIELRFESSRTIEQLAASLEEVPEISVVELAAATAGEPVAPVAPVADAFVDASADDALDADAEADDLLAALQAELAERTTAREAGLMPAFEGPREVIGNAISENTHLIEGQREPAAASGGALYTNGNGPAAAAKAALAASLAAAPPPPPPVVPPTEAPVTPAAVADLAPAPAPRAEASAAPAPRAEEQPKKAEERARPAEEQMVVLDVGEESYGIPVQRVREIIRVPPITRVPNGPEFLEGVINLRGQVIPVMDLRKHLGIPYGHETKSSRVVVSELGRHTVGLMVDGVSEVVMVSTGDIEPPPALVAGVNDGQVCGVARLGERLVLFLDPDRVLPSR